MFIETDRPLAIGAEVTLRFMVPMQPEWIEVGGDVRWVRARLEGSDGVGLGVRFQGLRARDVWALNRFFLSND